MPLLGLGYGLHGIVPARQQVDPDVAGEGSGFGGIATRWEDSHRNAIRCDGKSHTERFAVDQIEDKSAYKTLTKGKAWVQFCLFDDTTPKGDGQTDFGEPVSSMVWAQVHSGLPTTSRGGSPAPAVRPGVLVSRSAPAVSRSFHPAEERRY